MIHYQEMGSHGSKPKELSTYGLETNGVYSYSMLDMLEMIKVRNHRMLDEQTLVAMAIQRIKGIAQAFYLRASDPSQERSMLP